MLNWIRLLITAVGVFAWMYLVTKGQFLNSLIIALMLTAFRKVPEPRL